MPTLKDLRRRRGRLRSPRIGAIYFPSGATAQQQNAQPLRSRRARAIYFASGATTQHQKRRSSRTRDFQRKAAADGRSVRMIRQPTRLVKQRESNRVPPRAAAQDHQPYEG